ncbi:MAG: DNA gyrase subunit A [Thermoguttaceae bacterium]|jgi:DNA gyrase subunit A
MGRLLEMPIEEELKGSYLTYAMSVIVSRALPDVRDGLKPSQRRILVAMNDLNLGPGAGRVKCAKISGDTSGNYHPHGEGVIYPTLVRMAQEWNMRHVLVDKQGNFGSIAGLPPAAMRYTEARLSPIAALLLEDLKLDTVDFIPTYDERRTEPVVLPSKFPNLLVNGSNGIAVGMATSIPPHNLGEICDALVKVIDEPDVSIDELLEIVPGPDFPTGGVVCGRAGIRRGYYTGRGNVVVRARAAIEEHNNRFRIVVSEIPFQQSRDRIEERIADAVNDGKIPGISGCRNESDLDEPVRLVLDLKRDADPEIVLNQLYQFTPLQDSFSIIFLALVDGKPRVLSIKELLEEFLRHRETVIRRRTQFLLFRARQRKHTVEGLLLAHANIDEVIRVIRSSATQAEAKQRLMQIQTPAALLRRALGDEGFAVFTAERGESENYCLTPVQADAILKMTLGQLVNLEQNKLADEHRTLLAEIAEYNRILSDRNNILELIREELRELKRKHAELRRTEISGEEIGDVNLEDLIEEEMMVVSITSNGYVKRTPVSAYRAQRRGGKGLTGAKTEDEDPVQHLFVASTHAYLLFFTNKGKVYWRKVYDLPQLARDSRGRAVVNLLNLSEGEQIADCRAVKDFNLPDHYLVMATARGLVKKTRLAAYSRPMKTGIIAIKLREGDELVDVVVAKPGDELVLATAKGMAIRFKQSDARPVGRNSSGVKGIRLTAGDSVVGMVVTDPEATLLTACANGYGKRTPFGPNLETDQGGEGEPAGEEIESDEDTPEHEDEQPETEGEESRESEEGELTSGHCYRTQRRGGKGLRDVKTSDRNGPAIGIVSVRDEDELFIITARGKIQRISVADISIIGRNTQGVKIMSLDEDDKLVAVKRVPKEENGDKEG